jgi:hypothetical protein
VSSPEIDRNTDDRSWPEVDPEQRNVQDFEASARGYGGSRQKPDADFRITRSYG